MWKIVLVIVRSFPEFALLPVQKVSALGNKFNTNWFVILLLYIERDTYWNSSLRTHIIMMTSSNGNIFRVTGVQEMHWSPVNSPHKGQWRRVLMFSLICAWTNGWICNRDASHLRRHRAHYDVAQCIQHLKDLIWPMCWSVSKLQCLGGIPAWLVSHRAPWHCIKTHRGRQHVRSRIVGMWTCSITWMLQKRII